MNENENLQPVEKLTPFTRMVMSIGTLPSSFYASMSYYESMVWLYEYLKNQIIPTVNNNGEAVEELQEKYIELKNYIDTYFDNLDVQQEINNKLDEMAEDGTLTNLIKGYVDPIYEAYENQINAEVGDFKYNVNQSISSQNEEINSFKNSINSQVDIINDKVESATNGSPKGTYDTLTALTTADPNHDYVYLVAADGKWYYYNTSTTSWTAGGTYQSSGIAEKSITILNLDDPLQSNFNIVYGNPITTEMTDNSYYYVNNGEVDTNSGNNYKRFSTTLDINCIYNFTGYNSYSATGLIITDSNGDIIYNSNETVIAGETRLNKLFLCNEDGMTAYISINKIITDKLFEFKTSLRKVVNIYNNLKIQNTPNEVKTLNDYYIAYSTTISTNEPCFTSASGYTTKMYSMSKGVTYKITYKGFYAARGYATCKLDNTLLDIVETDTSGETTFTAEYDGYIFTSNKDTSLIGTVEIVNEAIDISITAESISKLKNKKIIYDGDSICESRTGATANNGGAYPYLISLETESTYVNAAVGGGKLISTIGSSGHSIVDNIVNLPTDGDLYCFEGGVNDYLTNAPLGTFDPEDYTSTPDITTISGALEKIFSYAINNFIGKPIIFVIIHKIQNPFVIRNGYNFPMLRERMIAICNKYSIPYYDAYNKSGLNGMIANQRTNFLNATIDGTADGLHPNKNGYEIYYVPQLVKLFESIIK